MNDIQMELGKFFYDYQRKHNGMVHPKEFIDALRSSLAQWEFDYGKNGENAKLCKNNICGYFCECD